MVLVEILVALLAGFYSGIMLCAILMSAEGNTTEWRCLGGPDCEACKLYYEAIDDSQEPQQPTSESQQ